MAAIAQFSVNFALNALDHAAIERAGAQRSAHDRASTAARLLGMLLAPLVVPALIDRGPALSALVAAAGVAAVGAAIGVVKGQPASEARAAQAAVANDGAMNADDRRVLGFALSVYVALYLIAANLIYLLRDVARVDHAERVGGATLTVVFFGALLGAGLRTKVFSPAKSQPNVKHLLAPLPWMALVAAALSSGWRVPVAALGAGGLALGLSYGVFLGALREHVSHGAGEEKRGALLSAFNNLANVSSLVAFALLAIAATATAGRTARAYPFVMTVAGALPFAGALLLARRAR
ncbi:MAG: hypothetical protein U0269_13955 [Polyangiales bacterium]